MNVVPDKINPEVGWRSWDVTNGVLHSVNQRTAWPIKKALEAYCDHGPELVYEPRRYGRIVPMGMASEGVADAKGHTVVFQRVFGFETGGLGPLHDEPPAVQLPKGWGYELVEVPQEVPGNDCSCGIYALESKEALLRSPYVSGGQMAVGAVSLWGKVIKGERGYRAQFAYPLFLYTDEPLLDYGVPTSGLSEFDGNFKNVITSIRVPVVGRTPRKRR